MHVYTTEMRTTQFYQCAIHIPSGTIQIIIMAISIQSVLIDDPTEIHFTLDS